MVVRLALMVLRIAVLLNLMTGILFWTGNADSLVPVHMGLGILAVLSLWTLGFTQALTPGGSWGAAISAAAFGIILAASGGAQDQILAGSSHWVIQGTHLLLGLVAIGFGEWIGRRYRHRSVTVAS